ncbi:hypothetical protein LBMAG42_56060 [Deltaproteobacteria bacterium]|nr:hypothetical protein LBMAG42_56060 [Deltaproteobacteria bacterium]
MAIDPHQLTREPTPGPKVTRSGDIVGGRKPQSQVDVANLPRLSPDEIDPYRFPFIFQRHPNKWSFIVTKAHPEGEWLPHLHRFALMPGANRVGEGGDMGLAALWLSSQRFVSIPRMRGPDNDYVREFDIVAGSTGKIRRVFYSAWDHVRINDGNAQRVFDMVGYRNWLRALVADGTIPTPRLHVIQRLCQIKGNRIERLLRLPSDTPANVERVARERATLQLMKASFAKQFGYDPVDIEAGHEALFQDLGGESSDMPPQDGEEPIEPKKGVNKVKS